MLTHMGASSAALTPHRYAVATEGVADFILLPSLLREATGVDSLPYQVVPGLAQLSQDGFRAIDSESDTMVYLTDGDHGGQELSRLLHRGGIPSERTFSLPTGIALEDLVSSETLTAAVQEELRRSGDEQSVPLVFPHYWTCRTFGRLVQKDGSEASQQTSHCVPSLGTHRQTPAG